MGTLVVAVLILLVVLAVVLVLVLSSTRRRSQYREADATAPEGDDAGMPGIGPDETPLGDTAEHAGEQTPEGETVAGQDADERGGTGTPAFGAKAVPSGSEADRQTAPGRVQRDPVGGEGEGKPAARGP